MEDKNTKKLQKLLALMDSESFTQEDFIKSFEMVLEIVSQTKKMTEDEVSNLRSMFTEGLNELKTTTSERFETLKARLLAEIEPKLAGFKDGKDGKDGRDGKDGKDGVDGKDGKDLQPETSESLRKKLLPIEIEDVSNLREELDELKARPVGRIGGGTSAMGVRQAFKYIAHTEQPSGLIDGANTTYTVKNEIFWVAGFTLNGEQVAELPNFTYKGKTITFSSAIPAAYSGKDFEIKYIG